MQPTAAYQMSLFPTEEEQIAYIDTAESVNNTPSAFSAFILQDDIDHILRTGGNADEARMKIAAEFSKQKPIEDRAAFLKNLYYGGNGLITENGRLSAWYGDDGVHIANAQEAEFGADGTRVFRDPTEDTPQPTVQERLEHYRSVVMAAVSEDTAYRNACGHSDRENAEIECNAAVRRAILGSKDMELIRLFSDVPEFRSRLHQEVFEGTYERLHDLLRPLSQDDIDDALRAWNGNVESKHAVVRYMEQHGREKETAAWLAHEYDGKEGNNLFIVRAGSPETVELTWPKVQRRIAQLIREDKFFTEQEKSLLENNPDYRLLGRLRADCEYFLGAGNRAEKHLWAGSVYAQIVKMRELYDALPQKPEWLTKEMIDDYAERMAPRYQVVAYHHFENGFDEKLDYQTLEEAEKAAQGYVDGTMESDGFAYDGAAIYDQQARKYLRIYGNYPDERAHAEVAGRELTAESAVLMERAKGLISDFCRSEYGSEADFSDPAKIGIAYTTVTDDEIPIQANIDLVNFRLERYLNDEHLETRQYSSLQELVSNELESLECRTDCRMSETRWTRRPHRWKLQRQSWESPSRKRKSCA